MKRTRANIVFLVLHVAAVPLALAAMLHLEDLVPTGSEGGWLTRIYIGVLLAAASLANAAVTIAAGLRRRQSPLLTLLGLLALSLLLLASLWIARH